MAHNSKRWIKAHDGTWKRSRNRTRRDRLRQFVSPTKYREARLGPPDCRECQKRYRFLYYTTIKAQLCRRCRELREQIERAEERVWWGKSAPKWYRRMLERKRRARYKDCLRNGRYEEIETRYPNDAAYSYW